MIYIETSSTDVYFNFALEYYFTTVKKLGEPVFLFWQTTPTLMVGKYQNTIEEINKKYADDHNIQVVRRMSGGGTIYTDLGGWQFTFIEYGETDEIHFKKYISPVIHALRDLNIPAEFNGRNDLLISGRKFSGNAQYKLNGSTVHHGSLLFSTDIEQMVASTTVDEYKIISKSIKSVRDRVTNISDHLKQPMDGKTFKEHMISYIMQGSESRYEPTEEDLSAIRDIAEKHFNNWNSIYGMSPKFSLKKVGRYAGGKLEISLEVKKGIIEGLSISGDFFASEKVDQIAEVLIGCLYQKEAIRDALVSSNLENSIYGVTPEELVNIIAS